MLRREAEAFALGEELLVERDGEVRLCSADEARPAAVAHVAVERELAHDQHASAHIRERPVHFIIFIAEYAQTEDFFGQLAAERGRIVRPDAEQDEKSPSDLPVQRTVNTNAGGIHAGNDCFHNGILS